MPGSRRSLWAIIIVLAALRPSGAAVYYVAPGGSDAGSGSSGAPFLTLQRGVDAAAPGDTILVRDGVYTYVGPQDGMAVTIDKAGSPASRITLQAEHHGGAVLDCALSCHSYINLGGAAAYWNIRGFDIRGGRWGGIFSNSGGGQGILVQENIIHDIGNRPDVTSLGITGVYTDHGASDFHVDGNVFHDIGRTAGQDGRHDHSIYSKGGLSVTNNVFYGLRNGWHMQTAAGFSGTIAGNTFFGPDPVAGTVGQLMLWDANSNVTVRDNIFYDPGSVAITTYALLISGGCTVDHNLVFSPSGGVGLADSLPGCTQSSNQLNVDPMLVRPSVPDYDFHLRSGSPAIDAGAWASGLSVDFAGSSRPSGGGCDVGAFEFQPADATASPAARQSRAPQRFLSPARVDGINDLAVFGPKASAINVFDSRGGKVFSALRGGAAALSWNARDLAGRLVESGVYVVQIIEDDGRKAYQAIAVVK